MISALRGALGFLTRLPVGHDEAAFDAFRARPAAFPLAGYVVGLPIAAAVALPLPAPTGAFALVVAVVLVTGVNHADGLADLGDAAVVHGDPERRRAVMTDTTVGVGAVLALAVGLLGLALAGLGLAVFPVGVAVAPLGTAATCSNALVGCVDPVGYLTYSLDFGTLTFTYATDPCSTCTVSVPRGPVLASVGLLALGIVVFASARLRRASATAD